MNTLESLYNCTSREEYWNLRRELHELYLCQTGKDETGFPVINPDNRTTPNNRDYLRSIIGKCFQYKRTDVAYPHGFTKSIRPYRIHENTLYAFIAFPDGYMGDYAFGINNGLADMFRSLKEY